ncbi:transmembrane protein 79-like [Scleropages formosus]|nr:transmembrane protein 79 [Scleropages formosus]XP_018601343.1 transmembrane protein 79 [Scleropages formosus]
MTSTGHFASKRGTKEFDSVKESISDIINQLQDIDPARLSFSPFLDLDTQISLAPVSDSPESSVEELHSPSHSVPGSQHSLEPLSAGEHLDRGNSCCKETCDTFSEQPRRISRKKGAVVGTMVNDLHMVTNLEDYCDNHNIIPVQALEGGILTGRDTEGSPLEATNLDSTVDEGIPLIRAPPDCIELAVWDSQEQQESGATLEAADKGCCSCSQCCLSGRVPAACSAFAALLILPGILYALYFYLPLDAPHCPDLVSRLIFTLHCCIVSALPVLLGMLSSAVCRFCSASMDPVGECPRRSLFLQLFVTSSTEQLFLYTLNLAVMATFLHQDQLKAVPILSGIFVAGRLVYWLSLHVCSAWRGFGSGLTVFPLLAMVVFNLYHLFDLAIRQFLPELEHTNSLFPTPSAWPIHIPGQMDFLPTGCSDTQSGRGYC